MDKNILSVLADNPQLLEALEKLLLKHFDLDQISLEQTNEEMGQAVRARLVGIYKVSQALKEIETHKTVKDSPAEDMPAR